MFSQCSSFTQSRSLNGILLLTDDTKISKSSFDIKQSVVSIGSWYDKHYIKVEGKGHGMTRKDRVMVWQA